MNQHSLTNQPGAPVPPDGPSTDFVVARPDEDQSLPHIELVGGAYTVVLSGNDTNGRYCLIDMHTPPNGGPPLDSTTLGESFTVLTGRSEATFHGEKSAVKAGETLHIPANAPHSWRCVFRRNLETGSESHQDLVHDAIGAAGEG